MRLRWIAFPGIALAGAALDVATKGVVFSRFAVGETVPLVPGLLSLQLATNRGIAGGFFPSPAWQFVSLAAIPLVAWGFLGRKGVAGRERLSGAFILGGTIGNAWDRVCLGYVRDFIRVPGIPNFNLADLMLSCGIAGLFLLWILHDRRPVGEARPACAGEPDDGGLGDVGRDHGPCP
jgi:signal peptidase II